MKEQNYVIWLEFDDNFTEFLNEKCAALNECGIAPGIRPAHLTLAFVKSADIQQLIEFTKEILQKNITDLVIDSIGQFSGGILYYSPQVSEKLLKLHRDLCEGLSKFGELTWDLYFPENWTPHIALTGKLDNDDVLKAFSIMRKDFSKITVSVKRILLWAYKDSGEKFYLDI